MTAPFHHPFQESQFDLFEWYPKYQSCQRFFVDHAQHTMPIQSVAAFVNIQLPQQKPDNTTSSNSVPGSAASSRAAGKAPERLEPGAALIPYIRRLVATGFDSPAVLHGFFGDDWRDGVGPIHETERRNFLFAAKSDNWLKVKAHYDMADGQLVPFLRPLKGVSETEIQAAELDWSNWLATQDWMLGPRTPPAVPGQEPRIKMEED